jgi:hypothetical protein
MPLKTHATGTLIATCLLVACAEGPSEPFGAATDIPSFARVPGDPGAAADRQLYQVRLGAEPESRSEGIMRIEIVGGYIAVTVHAAGLMPGLHIPQHIHLNPTCNPGGGILLNLDAGLTVPGEGAGTGTAYPVSNDAGVVNYHAQRSLTDLRAAVQTYRSVTLATTDELISWLNLEERNGHMHVAVGPPFPAVNCGEVVRLN